MRAMIIIAGAALALGGCGNHDQTDNNQNVDESLSAENIVSNDVTAIDAVTGDAANMAADVNYSEIANVGDNLGDTTKPSTPKRPSAKPSRPSASPAPAENSATPEPIANSE